MSKICKKCKSPLRKHERIIKVESYIILDNGEDMNPDFEVIETYHKKCYQTGDR